MMMDFIANGAVQRWTVKTMDDSMWNFLKNGKQKSNIPVLKNLVNTLIKMTTQKTAGQRDDKPNDVPFESLEMLKWAIICEAVALVLSGDLDKIEVGK